MQCITHSIVLVLIHRHTNNTPGLTIHLYISIQKPQQFRIIRTPLLLMFWQLKLSFCSKTSTFCLSKESLSRNYDHILENKYHHPPHIYESCVFKQLFFCTIFLGGSKVFALLASTTTMHTHSIYGYLRGTFRVHYAYFDFPTLVCLKYHVFHKYTQINAKYLSQFSVSPPERRQENILQYLLNKNQHARGHFAEKPHF